MNTNIFTVDFEIKVSFGSQSVTFITPAGPGLPNRATIKYDGLCSMVNSTPTVCVQQSVHNPEQSSPVPQTSVTTVCPVVSETSEIVSQTQTEQTTEPVNEIQNPEENTENSSLPQITLEELFSTRYKDKKHVYKHMCNALNKHVEFKDLTKPNLMKIKEYLLNTVSINSASMYCAVIKSAMNLYADEGVFNCKGFAKILKQKKEPSVNVYLSEDEIRKIEEYVPQNRTEEMVKNRFLIECYTGARLSDVNNITIQDIKDGYLTYVSKKTKTLTKVPVHKNLETLLMNKTDYRISRSIYNRTIKIICQRCNICEETNIFYHGKQRILPKFKYIGSHTARRSFATNLSLRNVPTRVIGNMMGHSGDTRMTEKYILADIEAMDENAMAFFNK